MSLPEGGNCFKAMGVKRGFLAGKGSPPATEKREDSARVRIEKGLSSFRRGTKQLVSVESIHRPGTRRKTREKKKTPTDYEGKEIEFVGGAEIWREEIGKGDKLHL